MIQLLVLANALAAEERAPILVVGRGLVERWSDPAIASVYKSGAWLGGLGVVVPVVGPVGVDLELGFVRLQGTAGTLELFPLSGLVEASGHLGPAEGFVGLGPTWTGFTERAGSDGSVVDGARVAVELRGGIRVDTGLVDPPMAPAPTGPVRAVDLEIYLGRRSELPGSDKNGFHLGAWRACLGLGAAF